MVVYWRVNPKSRYICICNDYMGHRVKAVSCDWPCWRSDSVTQTHAHTHTHAYHTVYIIDSKMYNHIYIYIYIISHTHIFKYVDI